MVLLAPNAKRNLTGERIEMPHDVANIITEQVLKRFAGSILNDLKDLISTENPRLEALFSPALCPRYPFGITWWSYQLKSIDFLNHFLSKDVVRKFFEDPKVFANLIEYLEVCFRGENNKHLHLGSYRLTEHWYWTLLHKSFEAFSKEAEEKIDAFFLLKLRFENKFKPTIPVYLRAAHPGIDPDLADFSQWFPAKKFLNLRQKHLILETEIKGLIRKDVARMIDLITIENNDYLDPRRSWRTFQIQYICDVLNFVEHQLSASLISEILLDHPKAESFDDRFKLIEIGSRMDSLHHRAEQLYHYVYEKSSYIDRSQKNKSKSSFDDHVDEFTYYFNEYKKEFNRVAQKPPSPGANGATIAFPSTVQRIIEHFEKALLELREMSDTISVSQ